MNGRLCILTYRLDTFWCVLFHSACFNTCSIQLSFCRSTVKQPTCSYIHGSQVQSTIHFMSSSTERSTFLEHKRFWKI